MYEPKADMTELQPIAAQGYTERGTSTLLTYGDNTWEELTRALHVSANNH